MPFAEIVDPWMYGVIALSLMLAGLSKGVAGIGLPVLAIPFMTLVIDLRTAVTLMPVALVASNIWQVATSRQRRWALAAYWPVLLTIPVGTLIGVSFLRDVDEALLKAAVGAIIIAFVAFSFWNASWRLPPSTARWLGPLAGVIGGVIGGMAAIFAPPLIIFLIACGIDKERFVSAIGLFFIAGSVSLAILLAAFGLMETVTWLWSAVAYLPVLLGQVIGGLLRGHIQEATFRRIVLCVLALAAANMIRSAL